MWCDGESGEKIEKFSQLTKAWEASIQPLLEEISGDI
jgi:hypothetical protein